MQHRNRLGDLWVAAVDLSPGRNTLPRVYIGTAFDRLSPAGVEYFGQVAESVTGIRGVFDASGNEMLGYGNGFFLALDLTEVAYDATDGRARELALQFMDRLRERLDNISDEDYLEALTKLDNIHNLAEVMAYSADTTPYHYDE